MRAVQIRGSRDLGLADLPQPTPGPGEELVRLEWAALCSTDRKMARRGQPRGRVPGHEMAGRLPDGQLVGVHTDVGCGACRHCREGHDNRCASRVAIGIDRDGGLAEWVVAPTRHVVPMDAVAPELVPLIEPLACCVHAVSLLRLEPEMPAVVVGAGAMGMLCLWVLQAEGARVAVCQRSEARRALAARLGAEVVIAPEQDPAQALGVRPRAIIVAAPGAEALHWALQAVDVGGQVHVFSGTEGGAAVDANLVHYRHVTLLGSTGSGLSDYLRARDLVQEGRIPLTTLPRKTIALEEVPRVLLDDPDPVHLRVTVAI